jgi:hypothetical protein
VADIAGGEDAGQAGLQRARRAGQSPPGAHGQVGSGEDEPVLVAADLGRQPVGARHGADEDHQRRGGNDLSAAGSRVSQGQGLQLPGAGGGGDLGGGSDADVGRRGDLVDQVLRHPRGQGLAADHDGDLPGVPGQVDRGLAGGVGPAGDVDVLAGEGGALGCGRPIEDAGAEQRVQPGSVEPAVGHAGGDEDTAGADCPAVGQAQRDAVRAGLEPGDRAGQRRDGAERPRLLERPGRQARSAYPAREAEVVADQRAAAGLPADGFAFQ